jgi:hypothetical protein
MERRRVASSRSYGKDAQRVWGKHAKERKSTQNAFKRKVSTQKRKFPHNELRQTRGGKD